MDRIDITISPDAKSGIIRNILGMNNSPRMTSAEREEPEKALFQKIHPARTRFHDAAIENPRYALVDISRIFPLFHADENDPRNYQFAETDYYLKMAVDCGTKLEFRLGETIEHSRERYLVKPPADPEKWARICLNIIRHYNEGWADGLHLGIEYWSIWEEPDNEKLFDGPYEKYLELYTVTAKAIKKEFPHLKVGGPNTMGGNGETTEKFFCHCRDTETPVDFAEYTTYRRDPQGFMEQFATFESIVRKYGFTETELCISEWHYGPLTWQTYLPGAIDSFYTAESAAFTTLIYTKLLDTDISMAFYYAWATGNWGVTDKNGGRSFMPVGHALTYFAEMTECRSRLLPQVSGADENTAFLCGETESGSIKVMASFFKSHNSLMTFHVPGKTLCRARRIEDNEQDPQKIWEIAPDENGDFACCFEAGGNAVFLFEFV